MRGAGAVLFTSIRDDPFATTVAQWVRARRAAWSLAASLPA
jgi:hypothetical protein